MLIGSIWESATSLCMDYILNVKPSFIVDDALLRVYFMIFEYSQWEFDMGLFGMSTKHIYDCNSILIAIHCSSYYVIYYATLLILCKYIIRTV